MSASKPYVFSQLELAEQFIFKNEQVVEKIRFSDSVILFLVVNYNQIKSNEIAASKTLQLVDQIIKNLVETTETLEQEHIVKMVWLLTIKSALGKCCVIKDCAVVSDSQQKITLEKRLRNNQPIIESILDRLK